MVSLKGRVVRCGRYIKVVLSFSIQHMQGPRESGNVTRNEPGSIEDSKRKLDALRKIAEKISEAEKFSINREDVEKGRVTVELRVEGKPIQDNVEKLRLVDSMVAKRIEFIDKAKSAFEKHRDLIKQGLLDKMLIVDAIETCNEFLGTSNLREDAGRLVASVAENLFEQISSGSVYTDEISRLTARAYHGITAQKEFPSDASDPDARKIVELFKSNEGFFKRFLGETSNLDDEQSYVRYKTLLSMMLVPSWNENWPYKLLADHIVQMIKGNQIYTGPAPYPEDRVTEPVLQYLFNINVSLSGYLLGSIFKAFGVSANAFPHVEHIVFTKSDDESEKKESQTPVVRMVEQLIAIQKIEAVRPGATAELHKRFGIRWFSRYPMELLIKQYDERDLQVSYGVYLSATGDWNCSFFSESDKELISHIATQMASIGMSMRIVESQNKVELAKSFISLDKSYGERNKIGLLVIRAHGDKEHVTLGEYKGQYIDLADLEGAGFRKSRSFFVDDCILVLDGCSMGRRRGIGQKGSRIFGTIHASPGITPSGLENITIERNGGNMHVLAEYAIEHKGRDISVPGHVYKKGVKR